jgi:arylsulfatase A-like enzyme/Tfp pilus assembly protein PilF
MRRRSRHPLVRGAVAAALLLTACAPARRTRSPSSVVLVTIDTLRADRVNDRLTPALSALGREGVVFDQAITVAPLTLPAHASLFTARYPTRHTVRDNQIFALPDTIAMYPSLLKQYGYATAAFVSAVVLDHRYRLNRGFDVYDDEIDGPERRAQETLARAERWIDGAPRPFFAWVHLFEPHAPYRTGSYATEVTAADTALDAFFRHLRGARLWDDVVVSVTADHGESLGEHGEQTHGFFVYDAALRIPWILKAPGLPPRRVSQLVRIVDELPTIVELAVSSSSASDRATDGMPTDTDGVSLASDILRGRVQSLEAYSETFLPRDQFGWSPLAAIRTERFKYIEAPQPELYDVAVDPEERQNVLSSHDVEATRLRRVLAAISGRPATPERRAETDPRLTEKLMSLGYVGYSPAVTGPDASALADPKTKLAVYNLTMRALELSESGDWSGALDAVARAERIDPNVAQVWFLKGTLLGQSGRYDQAAAALERTLALNPRYTAARFKLALALLRLDRADRAADALNEVVREEPGNFRAWHNLAAIAYSRGDLDESERLERRAIALSPEYADAWNTLGAIALVRKRSDAAVDALTTATRLAPRNGQAFHNLSLAFRQAGQEERARTAAEQACTLDPRFCTY